MKMSIFILFYLSFLLNWLLILPGIVVVIWRKQKIALYMLGVVLFLGSVGLIWNTPSNPNDIFPTPEFTAITVIIACGIQSFVTFMNIKNAYDKYMKEQYLSEGN